MPKGQSDQAASQPAVKSRRERRVDWTRVKVFDKPELKVNYKLTKYQKGKKGIGIEPDLWVQAAIEAGLAEMVAPNADSPGGALMAPIDGKPIPKVDLDEILAEGIANTLRELNEKKKGA